jgi:glycosyltransferase involved in cell wall biosynthesis
MRIETHIITWNRSDTIHLTVSYYLKLGRVIVHDNFSDDNTREICEALGAEVRLFGQAGVLSDQAYLDVKNHAWKGSDADYVIVCDDDEILYHEDLNFILKQERLWGTTIFKTQGYSMHAELLPRGTWLELNKGFRDNNYSKRLIFDPSKVDINYIYGCHECRPKGSIIESKETLNVLHYRNVGGVGRLIKRHHAYEERRKNSPVNMKWNLGHHYSESDDLKREQWKESEKKSKVLSEVGIRY